LLNFVFRKEQIQYGKKKDHYHGAKDDPVKSKNAYTPKYREENYQRMKLYSVLQKNRTKKVVQRRDKYTRSNKEKNTPAEVSVHNPKQAQGDPHNACAEDGNKSAEKSKGGKDKGAGNLENRKYNKRHNSLNQGDHNVTKYEVSCYFLEFSHQRFHVIFPYRNNVEHKTRKVHAVKEKEKKTEHHKRKSRKKRTYVHHNAARKLQEVLQAGTQEDEYPRTNLIGAEDNLAGAEIRYFLGDVVKKSFRYFQPGMGTQVIPDEVDKIRHLPEKLKGHKSQGNKYDDYRSQRKNGRPYITEDLSFEFCPIQPGNNPFMNRAKQHIKKNRPQKNREKRGEKPAHKNKEDDEYRTENNVLHRETFFGIFAVSDHSSVRSFSASALPP
jgi:hypothetical protein